MDHILVTVLPSYKGDDWIDPLTGIRFEKSAFGGVSTYRVGKDRDLTNIKAAVEKGVLTLFEGEFDEPKEKHPAHKAEAVEHDEADDAEDKHKHKSKKK